MNYAALREAGIEHIQKLSGKLWTDHNTHDPGITILETLCYAITDLGNRVNQPIEDILAEIPPGREGAEFKNFFTAGEILPGKPVTRRDLRKALMDVSVMVGEGEEKELIGVKNAWISVASEPEIPLWAYHSKSELSDEPKPGHDPIDIKPLYEILLEFEHSAKYGDLNSRSLTKILVLDDPVTKRLKGVEFTIEIDLAGWDDPVIADTEPGDERNWISELSITKRKVPVRHSLDLKVDGDHKAVLSGSGPSGDELSVEDVEEKLNETIEEMISLYASKIDLIQRIVAATEHRFHSVRNLCEDLKSFHSLKIEGIAVCADIELHLDADVDQIQAEIFHEIATFLSPPVRFHTLSELMEEGHPVEEIFEGPLLNYGFLTDEELDRSERMKKIYVSDLVQIIMNVDGVAAVKHIEIANIPQGDDDIPSRSVKWCLELAHKKKFVPRLSVADSKITFYKENLPYTSSRRETEKRMSLLEEEVGSTKQHRPVLDLKIPEGRARGLYSYRSIREEFPVVYGVGSDGLPPNASQQRTGETRQLQGYLTFFDQLLANYLGQLSNVRELFAMNAGTDDHPADRSYFSLPVDHLMPEEADLFKSGSNYAKELQKMVETPEEFAQRRNRFLDHLMARFAEQFTDYAALTYRLAGDKAKKNLAENKLAFLRNYPQMSARRGTAFDYRDRCRIWSIGNRSGLEERASMQVGIDDTGTEKLFFSPSFKIEELENGYGFEIVGPGSEPLIQHPPESVSSDIGGVKETLEKVIITGQFRESFRLIEDDEGISFQLLCGDEILAISSHDEFAGSADAEVEIELLMEILENEFFGNPGSNRKNIAAPLNAYFEIEAERTGSEYYVRYRLYDSPYQFKEEHLLLEGEVTGEAENEIAAEEEMQEQKREFIWNVVTSGGRRENYVEDDSDELALRGRFGGELGIVKTESESGSDDRPDKLSNFFYETFLSNEGMHLTEHLLLRPKLNDPDEGIRDDFMPIMIDPDCEHCQLDNPYKYVASVILPYWQGRFGNTDFRTFLERKIRLECPAHVFLKICWVSNEQMTEYERRYKRWLVENTREETEQASLSSALNDLLEILDQLRNVYPVGRLHDCEESDTLEGSMILNNTILGSA